MAELEQIIESLGEEYFEGLFQIYQSGVPKGDIADALNSVDSDGNKRVSWRDLREIGRNLGLEIFTDRWMEDERRKRRQRLNDELDYFLASELAATIL